MASKDSLEHFVGSYGDLLFDLCETILWNPSYSQIAFRSILNQLKRASRFQKYATYERSWILRVACSQLIDFYYQGGRRVSAEEQIKLDANENVNTRLKQFHLYFHRLRPEEQMLLFLKDKYQVPYSEIASALATPEDSLKTQRQQALRTLEEWLWNNK